MKAGLSIKDVWVFNSLEWGTKKKTNLQREIEPEMFCFRSLTPYHELQKIMNSLCTCLTFGDGAASTLVYIRKTQDKRIFTSRKAMMLNISERYCGRNCDCSEEFLHEIKMAFKTKHHLNHEQNGIFRLNSPSERLRHKLYELGQVMIVFVR